MTTRGIVYVVDGASYLREAARSARSVKAYHPDVPVTIFTDTPSDAAVFDEVVRIEHPHGNRLDKLSLACQVPYRQVLFLDSDTFVCGPLDDVFALLGRFDIAMAHAPRRVHEPYPALRDVPDSFPEYNSGVMAFRNTAGVRRMFDAWSGYYAEALESEWFADLLERRGPDRTLQDQHFLRKALYGSDLRIATLPYEYNCRLVAGIVKGDVRILHGRHPDLPRIAGRINQRRDKRLFVPSNRSLYAINPRQAVLVPYLAAVSVLAAMKGRMKRLFRADAAPSVPISVDDVSQHETKAPVGAKTGAPAGMR